MSIYSVHILSEKLNLWSISISKSSNINYIAWEDIKLIYDLVFANSLTKIIVCNSITQYSTKEQRLQLIEEAHFSALGGHKGVTMAYNRIWQKKFWENKKKIICNLFKRLAKRLRIKQFRTTAFHSQSNGSLEQSHHVLGEYLKQIVAKNSEYDDWLELPLFSYDTPSDESTKCTPYELVFGKLARETSSEPLSEMRNCKSLMII